MKERIGPYRIENVIAEGGMGLVYKGRHDTLGRCAAIKTLLPKNALDASSRDRFLREARTQALIAPHGNVVAVYDLIPEDGALFIAMEYVDGETLSALLRRNANGLGFDDALRLIGQMLAALEHIHGRKIIHRDVKPSNVLISGGLVKLTDFGIALMPDAPRLTASQQRIGTLEYMSPEQLQGRDIDHRTDVYSAGIVLYAMLAGRLPFPSRDILQAISERMAGPPDLRGIRPDLPDGVREALGIALQMEPEHRFQSAAAFAGALKDLAAGFLHPAADPQ
ncbi:MAG: serine/threonine-protein kinase, partial [Thermoanaerobaculia bacterium]